MSDNLPIEKIKQRAAENASARIDWLQTDHLRGDSPIEKALFLALHTEIDGRLHQFTDVYSPPPGARFDPTFQSDHRVWGCFDLPLIVESQISILQYRVDFLISSGFRGLGPWLVVECDGHDFHERTKDQAARDRSRDRALQEAGYPVFRFTGAEIWRDPCGCADQIIKWADAN